MVAFLLGKWSKACLQGFAYQLGFVGLDNQVRAKFLTKSHRSYSLQTPHENMLAWCGSGVTVDASIGHSLLQPVDGSGVSVADTQVQDIAVNANGSFAIEQTGNVPFFCFAQMLKQWFVTASFSRAWARRLSSISIQLQAMSKFVDGAVRVFQFLGEFVGAYASRIFYFEHFKLFGRPADALCGTTNLELRSCIFNRGPSSIWKERLQFWTRHRRIMLAQKREFLFSPSLANHAAMIA